MLVIIIKYSGFLFCHSYFFFVLFIEHNSFTTPSLVCLSLFISFFFFTLSLVSDDEIWRVPFATCCARMATEIYQLIGESYIGEETTYAKRWKNNWGASTESHIFSYFLPFTRLFHFNQALKEKIDDIAEDPIVNRRHISSDNLHSRDVRDRPCITAYDCRERGCAREADGGS